MYKRIKQISALVLLGGVLALGCSQTPETVALNEDRQVIRTNNWILCQKMLKDTGLIEYHVNHTHKRSGAVNGTRNVAREAVRDDLHYNRCRRLMGEYWEKIPTEL